jgi:hypothetical protein
MKVCQNFARQEIAITDDGAGVDTAMKTRKGSQVDDVIQFEEFRYGYAGFCFRA